MWRLLVLVVTATALTPLAVHAAAGDADPTPSVQRLGDTVLDPTARGNLTWAATANVASYQQDALVTEGNFQYTAWYAADRTAVLARRALPAGAWQAIELDAVLYADDSHNNITLAISPRDGRLHVALSTHANRIRYVRSVPGLTTGAAAWASTSFEPVAAQLRGAVGAPRSWTYPTFERFGEDLLLTWRAGSSVRGRQVLARYDADGGGSWQYLGAYTGPDGEWSSVHGTSASRNAYLHGFSRNPATGDLEITWTWRESPGVQHPLCPDAPANRDLGYARSPDGGLTWLNDAGDVIGRTGTRDLITTDDVHVVVPIAAEAGMINQESQAFDSTGRIHVVTSQIDDSHLTALGGCPTGDYYATRAAYAHPVHHWRDGDGWHSMALPVDLGASGRSQLVFDAEDTAYLVLPDGRIAAASAQGEWSRWRIVFASDDFDSISELSVDRLRVRRDGVLSAVSQATGAPQHAPSAFRVTDFWLGSGPAPVSPGVITAPPATAYRGSAAVWPRASATSQQSNFPAHFAVDDDPSSGWSSGVAVHRIIDGIEWVTLADALQSTSGGATPEHPQALTITYPSPRWVGQVTLDPGGAQGPRDWKVRGRVAGQWVDLTSVVDQSQEAQTYAVTRRRIDALQVVVTRGHRDAQVRIAEVSTADRVPSNRFTVRTSARQPRRGTATLAVKVSEEGVLRLFRSPRVKGQLLDVTAGTATVRVEPRGPAARRVSRAVCRRSRGDRVKAVIRVKVRFTPTGGQAAMKTKAVRVVRTC